MPGTLRRHRHPFNRRTGVMLSSAADALPGGNRTAGALPAAAVTDLPDHTALST